MYKTYLFLEGEPGSEPFGLRARQAAAAVGEAFPGLVGYTQTRSQREQIEDRAVVPFTGIAELWFAHSRDALNAAAHADSIAPLLTPGTRVGPIVTGRARTVLRLARHHQGDWSKAFSPFAASHIFPLANFNVTGG
ncbi:MAG: hypothetical protein R3E84_22105 [Pseudomonadales bacterium]